MFNGKIVIICGVLPCWAVILVKYVTVELSQRVSFWMVIAESDNPEWIEVGDTVNRTLKIAFALFGDVIFLTEDHLWLSGFSLHNKTWYDK